LVAFCAFTRSLPLLGEAKRQTRAQPAQHLPFAHREAVTNKTQGAWVMTYVCKKTMYDSIANVVTAEDLRNSKKTLKQFMCDYFGRGLNLPDGTITETGAYSSGDLIENPAYIIESIWRDELNQATADIDYASIDPIGHASIGLRKDWKFARSLNTVEW
jgi:hypothetical protein